MEQIILIKFKKAAKAYAWTKNNAFGYKTIKCIV